MIGDRRSGDSRARHGDRAARRARRASTRSTATSDQRASSTSVCGDWSQMPPCRRAAAGDRRHRSSRHCVTLRPVTGECSICELAMRSRRRVDSYASVARIDQRMRLVVLAIAPEVGVDRATFCRATASIDRESRASSATLQTISHRRRRGARVRLPSPFGAAAGGAAADRRDPRHDRRNHPSHRTRHRQAELLDETV